MKKLLPGVCLLLSATLALAQMPGETRQEAMLAIQQGNYTHAAQLLRTWAERGDAQAQYYLGVMYSNGDGFAQNNAKARKWWEKAAAQGDAKAQYNLGVIYYDGQGVAQSYAKAREWWEKAAAQGYAEAQYNLGFMYAGGRGVAKDLLKARKWYEQAAAQTENPEIARRALQALEKMY
ncbi:tetratricopeptide repeat protein [Dentiradicibacter hellwigii]|uniref:Tetratricopeptide repeat protein n=1 Tax=Dentiradicibacter hellwigii TaxID=3149053 RepID=A0ABV4UCI9_9RHOO